MLLCLLRASRREYTRLGIANQIAEIEKTKNALEREQAKVNECEAVKSELPQILLDLLEQGKITQWRKYPNRFFVLQHFQRVVQSYQ